MAVTFIAYQRPIAELNAITALRSVAHSADVKEFVVTATHWISEHDGLLLPV